jgi:hypothetical protein
VSSLSSGLQSTVQSDYTEQRFTEGISYSQTAVVVDCVGALIRKVVSRGLTPCILYDTSILL